MLGKYICCSFHLVVKPKSERQHFSYSVQWKGCFILDLSVFSQLASISFQLCLPCSPDFLIWWLFHSTCVVLKSWVLESTFPLEYFWSCLLQHFYFFSIWAMCNMRIWYKGNQNAGVSIHSSVIISVGFPLLVSLIHSLSCCRWEGMCGLKPAGAHCSLQNSSCLFFRLWWTEEVFTPPVLVSQTWDIHIFLMHSKWNVYTTNWSSQLLIGFFM